jgi:hypothetical protein
MKHNDCGKADTNSHYQGFCLLRHLTPVAANPRDPTHCQMAAPIPAPPSETLGTIMDRETLFLLARALELVVEVILFFVR